MCDEDMAGFLAPQRIEAIVSNLVDSDREVNGWIAYIDEPQRFVSPPNAVTTTSWLELKSTGWQWLDNVSNDSHGDAIVEGVRNRHGAKNVLVGWPWDRDRPVDDPSHGQIGVYVLEILSDNSTKNVR